MGDEHIAEFRGLAAHLAVKIQTPRCETPLLQHSLWKYIYMSLDQIISNRIHSVQGVSDTTILAFMTMVVFLMSIGNWSVSQPKSGDPVLESIEPNIPNLSIKNVYIEQGKVN